MIKKKFYTITKKSEWGSTVPVFRFENMDGAIDMFKFLMQGKAIELEHLDIPDDKQEPDKDNYVPSEYVWVDKGEREYHLGSEVINVYTEEEYKILKEVREDWKESFNTKKDAKK